MVDGCIQKFHGAIIPNEYLEIPIYTATEFRTKRCQLNSFITHIGDTMFSGHYAAVLKTATSYMKADENAPARSMNHAQFKQCCRQGFLFFY